MTDNSITSSTRKKYRQIGHHLRPIVTVGNSGITGGVIDEMQRALRDHELIKVKVGQGSEIDRKEGAAELAQSTKAHLAGVIGRVWILYRPDPEEPRIQLD